MPSWDFILHWMDTLHVDKYIGILQTDRQLPFVQYRAKVEVASC